MGADEHSRWRVVNPTQHPLAHDISAYAYANPRLPNITLLGDALDYIVAVLYPNYKGTVATPAALPGGAAANDYYFVSDDGDGKGAGYVWSVIDNAGQWIKRYDVDWTFEAILGETLNRTMPMYVHKYGMRDRGADGNFLAGVDAGQHIYGSTEANEHLTLHANSGDAGGGHTGYVQVDDTFRPKVDSSYALGTTNERWSNLFADAGTISTMTFGSGSITDTTGTISFGDEDLTTTGDIGAVTITATTFTAGTLSISDGSISDTDGTISFGATHLETTGHVKTGTLTIADGSISDSDGSISFSNTNLTNVGTIGASTTTVTRLDADNVRIDGNTISIIDEDGNLTLQANGVGVVSVASAMSTGNITTTGTIGITGSLTVDSLTLNGSDISTAAGDISVTPFGALIFNTTVVKPNADATTALGLLDRRYTNLFLSSGISDGTNSIGMSALVSLRDILTDIAVGYSIFWDGTKFVSSRPDLEVDHTLISNITTGDAGHTQFVMLSGRAGGQTIQGGTLTTQNLTLRANAADATGAVLTYNNFLPTTDAVYDGGWTGKNLGSASYNFLNVYTKGEHFGFRFENVAELPANSGSSAGRAVFLSTTGQLFLDTGAAWVLAGRRKFKEDLVFNGTDTSKDVDVSASISDARDAIWQIKDNATNFEVMLVSIQALNATTLRITADPPLAAGSYRLLGIE